MESLLHILDVDEYINLIEYSFSFGLILFYPLRGSSKCIRPFFTERVFYLYLHIIESHLEDENRKISCLHEILIQLSTRLYNVKVD